jgi:hypothetical protein
VLDVAVDIIKVLLYIYIYIYISYDRFSLDAKPVLNENLSDTQC